MANRPLTEIERKEVEAKLKKAKEDRALTDRYIANLELELREGCWDGGDPEEFKKTCKKIERDRDERWAKFGKPKTLQEQIEDWKQYGLKKKEAK